MNTKHIFLTNEEQWYYMHNKVKEYIDKHKKKPSSHDKNTYIKKIGNWIQIQKQNYANKKNSMNNVKLYNVWTKFIDEYKIYFK
jgi:hypothetical protein